MRRVLTQSAARCYRRCPREYSIAYAQGYRTLTDAEPLRFGSLIHRGLESVWRDGELAIPSAEDVDPYEHAKAAALLVGYVARWGYPDNVQGVEVQFRAPLRNPETGRPFDDTLALLDSIPLGDDDRRAIYGGNALRVFPRLTSQIDQLQGAA